MFEQASRNVQVSFSVRIPRGMDLNQVYVGWTTPIFKDEFKETSDDEGTVHTGMEILQKEDSGEQWRVVNKVTSGFLVQMSKLLPDSSHAQDNM